MRIVPSMTVHFWLCDKRMFGQRIRHHCCGLRLLQLLLVPRGYSASESASVVCLVQGGLEAAPLEVACSRLGKKWDKCFEQGDEEEEDEPSDPSGGQEAATGHKGKKRRSLFNKLRLSTRSLGQVSAALLNPR